MEKDSLLHRYIIDKPNLLFSVGFLIAIMVGILGEVFSWTRVSFSPYLNIVGGAVALGGLMIHLYCHRVHKQAHEQSEQIERIVTTGVFSIIRHPMYLSLILMFLGVAIAWGIVWMLLPSLLFSLLTVFIAIKEEEFLLERFGHQYEEYRREVPWRFIPKIF
jgi:protein-S-isoprenylcysteine O-methyltransferase Ste14